MNPAPVFAGIRFRRWAAWLLAAAAIVAGAGAVPAWVMGGPAGLKSELAAGLSVLAVRLAAAAVVARQAARGSARLAYVQAVLGMVRVAASLALAAAVGKLCRLPLVAVLVWVLPFYLALQVAETLFLARALRQNTGVVRRGEGPCRTRQT